METYQYFIIAAVAIVMIAVISILLYKSKKSRKQTKGYELDSIVNLLDKSNIQSIDYIRNKIVINFKDVTMFDTNQLHEKGALGISIVGDKVKFYLDGGNEINESVFKELKNFLEG